jgi:hypothetical protein
MTTSTPTADRFGSHVPQRRRLLRWALVLNLQLVVVALYYSLGSLRLSEPRYVLYGLVWLNVGYLAVRGTRLPDGVPFRTRRRALAVATAYFGLLAVTGGMLGTGVADPAGLRVAWLTPGWGPALVYAGGAVSLVVMPAYLVGYTALAYLVYAALLEATPSALGGVLGVLSCVSCSWPILAAVGSTIAGGAGFLSASALSLSYDVSTAVFLATVALLYWRPGIGD